MAAKLINGDSLNRKLAQTDGALSPIRLKQNYLPVHHYPKIMFCQPDSGLEKNCQLFLGRYNSKFADLLLHKRLKERK